MKSPFFSFLCDTKKAGKRRRNNSFDLSPYPVFLPNIGFQYLKNIKSFIIHSIWVTEKCPYRTPGSFYYVTSLSVRSPYSKSNINLSLFRPGQRLKCIHFSSEEAKKINDYLHFFSRNHRSAQMSAHSCLFYSFRPSQTILIVSGLWTHC